MSVVCGVLLFFALLFLLFPVFSSVYERLLPAGQTQTSNNRFWVSAAFFLLYIISLLLCGMLAALISTRKKRTHAFITGIVLLLIYVFTLGINTNWNAVAGSDVLLAENILIALLIFLVPALGGILFTKIFRGKKS